jgi:hypothetical protein
MIYSMMAKVEMGNSPLWFFEAMFKDVDIR